MVTHCAGAPAVTDVAAKIYFSFISPWIAAGTVDSTSARTEVHGQRGPRRTGSCTRACTPLPASMVNTRQWLLMVRSGVVSTHGGPIFQLHLHVFFHGSKVGVARMGSESVHTTSACTTFFFLVRLLRTPFLSFFPCCSTPIARLLRALEHTLSISPHWTPLPTACFMRGPRIN